MIADVVFAALRGLVSDRVYPVQFPQELIDPPKTQVYGVPYPTWPAIRYQEIGSDNGNSICGTGSENTDTTQIQIDVVAVSWQEMRDLVSSVIAALQVTSPPCSRDFLMDDYDVDLKVFRGILRYSFYPSSPYGSSP